MGIELLKKFGESVLNEMTQIFEEGSNVVIPFTEDSLREICSMYGLDFSEVSRAFNVGFVSCGVNDLYISLACCAFQVMVAYDCLATDSHSYNNKLANFIQSSRKYYGEKELQDTYAEEFHGYGSAKKQELLWEGAQKLLEKNGLHLRIPERTSYSGRYVQYPLKQRVIDRKTLQKYIDIFKKRYGNGEALKKSYSFDMFSNDLFKNSAIVSLNENHSLLGQKEARNVVKRIVFYCFCNWVEHEGTRRGAKPREKKDLYKIRLKNDSFAIFKNSKELQSVSAVPNRPFFYDETYDEWVLAYSNITPAEDGLVGVVLDWSEWKSKINLLNNAPYFEWEYHGEKRFYINPVKYISSRTDWLKKETIKFVGGVKDNDGRWIVTLLPTITNIKNQDSIVIDHRAYSLKNGTFDLNTISNLDAGVHVIRLFNRSPLLFETVSPHRNYDLQRGWTWEKRQPHFVDSVNGDAIISGLYTDVPVLIDAENKHWGNAKMERLKDRYDRIGVMSKIRGKIDG